MARPLHYEAAGANYHHQVMTRGEVGMDVFEDDSDRTVSSEGVSTEWR